MRRPALVVSPDVFNHQMQDVVLVAITSQFGDDRTLTIEEQDCTDGRLPKTSLVKPANSLRSTQRSSSSASALFAPTSLRPFCVRSGSSSRNSRASVRPHPVDVSTSDQARGGSGYV
jgi:PemK-like, MazF-like toxin of type II toxin-antitoxin system